MLQKQGVFGVCLQRDWDWWGSAEHQRLLPVLQALRTNQMQLLTEACQIPHLHLSKLAMLLTLTMPSLTSPKQHHCQWGTCRRYQITLAKLLQSCSCDSHPVQRADLGQGQTVEFQRVPLMQVDLRQMLHLWRAVCYQISFL